MRVDGCVQVYMCLKSQREERMEIQGANRGLLILKWVLPIVMNDVKRQNGEGQRSES